jgi:hypothetical protein
MDRDDAEELKDNPFGKAVSFQTLLLDRLMKCFENEVQYFGRTINQRWQRMNTLFVDHGSNVEMMKRAAFTKWLTRTTKNPRITADQRVMFEAIVKESEERTVAAINASRGIPSERLLSDNSSYFISGDDNQDDGQAEDMSSDEKDEVKDPRYGVTMYSNPDFGHLAEGVTRYRELWDVLLSYRQPPNWIRSKVMEMVTRCVKDPSYQKKWACINGEESMAPHLSIEECEGVLPYVEENDVIVRDRMFLGDNIDSSVLVLNGTWSMALKPNFGNKDTAELFQLLEKTIPKELYPRADKSGMVNEEDVLMTSHNCAWLDDVWRHGRVSCANGAKDNRQPLRRTASVTLTEVYEVEDPISEA